MSDHVLILVQYYVTAVLFVLYFAHRLTIEKRMNAINIVRGMYILIYAIIPIITLTHVFNLGIDSKTVSLSIDAEGLSQISEMGLFSIVGFAGLEIGYASKTRIRVRRRENNRHYDNRALWKASVVMSLVSLFALFLWTYPFGGPIAMFQYGTLIRSGRDIEGISNTFGFMKQFVPLAQFSSIISFALYKKERGFKNIINLIISGAVSIVYLIANDGRAPFLMYVVSILLLYFILRNKEKKRNGFQIVSYVIIAVVGFLFISNIYSIIGLFTGVSYQNDATSSLSMTGFLYDEFSWTVRNAQAVRVGIKDGYTFKFFNELLSGILAWLPSRFRPTWLPRLEKVNTQYWYGVSRVFGGKPPDIITAGLYTLWYPGVFILPFIWGYIIKQINYFFANRDESVYYDIIFVQLVYQFAKIIPYDDFALVTLNLFYIVIGHLIIIFFNRKYKERFAEMA